MNEEIVPVRASDLARAWVGLGDLSPRKYEKTSQCPAADQLHDKLKMELAKDPRVQDFLNRHRFIRRQTGNILVKGSLDGVKFFGNTVSLVEFKTVYETVERASEQTEEAGVFQLLVYIWMIRPILEKEGLTLSDKHYLGIYQRGTEKFLYRVVVTPDERTETDIWLLLAEHNGIVKEVR